MVAFFNAVGASGLNNIKTSGNNQLSYGRGTLPYHVPENAGSINNSHLALHCNCKGSIGHVALNNAGSAWKTTFTTSLPSGTYCDIVNGKKSNGKCTGAT